MEQMLIDFFTKATEVILLSRFTESSSNYMNFNKINLKTENKFQLKLESKYNNLRDKIPLQWTSSNHKLLVIEFLLNSKITGDKFLIEQWIFDLNDSTHNKKTSNHAENSQILYKKLSILIRSIIILASTLPLYRNYVNEKQPNKLKYLFTLDYNIHFSFRSLTNWHNQMREDSNLGTYNNNDISIPGLLFSFKINYLKNVGILFKLIEEGQGQLSSPLLNKHNEIQFNKRKRFLSSEQIGETGKSTSDTNRNNASMINNESPNYNFQADTNANTGNVSPIDSIFGTSSPIGTQKPQKILPD